MTAVVVIQSAETTVAPREICIMVKQNIAFLKVHITVALDEGERIVGAVKNAELIVVAAGFPFAGNTPCRFSIHSFPAKGVNVVVYKSKTLSAFLSVCKVLIDPVDCFVSSHGAFRRFCLNSGCSEKHRYCDRDTCKKADNPFFHEVLLSKIRLALHYVCTAR